MSRRTLLGLSMIAVLLAGVAVLARARVVTMPPLRAVPGPVDGARAMAHVERIVGFGPRPAGSASLRAAGDYILAELGRLGVAAREQVWTEEVALHGKTLRPRFRNLWATIPGSDPQGRVLVLGAHYDTKLTRGHPDPRNNFEFVGAIDGGGAAGLLLELARVLAARRNVPTIWLVWFDGEESFEFEWNELKALYGSRHFVARLDRAQRDKLVAMVLFDLIGDANIKIDVDETRFGDAGMNAIFRRVAERLGLGARVFRYRTEAMDDHLAFRDIGVKTIDLIDFRWRVPAEWAGYRDHEGPKPAPGELFAWWHTEHDTLDKMSPLALQLAGNLFWHALPELERYR